MAELGIGSLQRIGRFVPLEILRNGRKRLVVRCRDPHSGEVVVIKKVQPAWIEHAGVQRRTRVEAAVAAQANHPGLIEVLESGVEDGAQYLVLRYHAGGTLDDRLRFGGPLSGRRAVELGAKIAEALDHLHRAGFVHLDIKPTNILLSASLDPVVCDFGLVRSRRYLRRHRGYLGGTPGFMSPEQAFLLPRRVDQRADVFGLGVTLHLLSTGHLPFEAERRDEYFQELETSRVIPVALHPTLPDALVPVCRCILAYDPRNRYRTCRILADVLRAAL